MMLDARCWMLDAGCKILVFCILCLFHISSSYAQTIQDNAADSVKPDAEGYHESALRRAEIIFTSSIPFTAIHSYIGVRGVEMIRQRKVSPNMEDMDWAAVIGLTITFSGFVALWDWLHTRDEDISDRNLAPKNTIETSPSDTRYQINGVPMSNDSVLVSFYMEF